MSDEMEAEIPTADAVAHAVVAAARSMGLPPLTVFETGGGAVRFRAPALAALKVIYPDCSWGFLGGLVGYNRTSAQASLFWARKASWWDAEGAPAMEAALTALEGL